MLTLISPPVSARDTEKKLQDALNELYKTFFTGLPHDAQVVGGGTEQVTFPVVDLFFNQTQLPTPTGKSQIHTVFTDVRKSAERWVAENEKMVFANATVTIFVRTANQGAQENKADFENRRLGDNVKELFESQDRYALARLGIRHPKVVRGPAPLATTGFQVRMLIVAAQLQYRIARNFT